MKTTFAATAALLSTSYASTVTLETTKCPQTSAPTEQFDIELNTEAAVPKYLPSVCGIKIVSASDEAYIQNIQCQAFKDAAGTTPGSAVFTYESPALIATNPVQLQSIYCIATASSSGAAPNSTGLERRQLPTDIDTPTDIPTATSDLVGLPSGIFESSAESSAAETTSDAVRTSGDNPRSTLFVTSTADVPESTGDFFITSATGPTTVQTAASSGMPSSSNGTALSTSRPTPSQSSPSPSETTNAAGQAVVGFGVVAAAFAALVL